LLAPTFAVRARSHLQGYRQDKIDGRWMNGRWKAVWISVSDTPQNAYGVYHFRKKWTLDRRPERFVVHVSADNRYKRFVNDRQVSAGPARDDIYNWNFETVDLAPWLEAGEPFREEEGNSAFQDLLFVTGLDAAADMEGLSA